MTEIEVKILDIDIKSTEKTIKKLGGKLVHKNLLYREQYFTTDNESLDFSSLRLRSEGNEAYITMKFKKQGNKKFLSRKEIQVKVSDFKIASTLIQLMGFRPIGIREKIRKEYRLGNIKIELDQYPEIPPYLEIEGSSQRSVKQFLTKLGYDLKYTVHFSATEIIKQYGKNPNNLVFKNKKK